MTSPTPPTAARVTVPFRGKLYRVERRWWQRRLRARKVILYGLLLALVIFMIGPLFYAAISSFNDNALEFPPNLWPAKLRPSNWLGAWRLGQMGSGDPWMGGFASGHTVELEMTFRYPPSESDPPLPRVQVLSYQPSVRRYDPGPSTAVKVIPMKRHSSPRGEEIHYRVRLTNEGQERFSRLPIVVISAKDSQLVSAALTPTWTRSRFSGTYSTWEDTAPGLLGYIFQYYIQAWTIWRGRDGKPLFPMWVLNSIWLALLSIIITIPLASISGYALARLHFPGRKPLFFLVIFTMMVPGQVTFISNYLLVRDGIFGLSHLLGMNTFLNTYYALFLPGLVSTTMVFLMKQFMESIPRELEEAARIDGANTFQIYLKVILPLSLPAMAAVAILSFQGSWNGFFWPMVVLTSGSKYTLPLGLNFFRGFAASTPGVDWNSVLAGTVISAIPILLVFIFFQRYFIEGLKLTGTKG